MEQGNFRSSRLEDPWTSFEQGEREFTQDSSKNDLRMVADRKETTLARQEQRSLMSLMQASTRRQLAHVPLSTQNNESATRNNGKVSKNENGERCYRPKDNKNT